jgi:hypothetical protein
MKGKIKEILLTGDEDGAQVTFLKIELDERNAPPDPNVGYDDEVEISLTGR